MNYRRRHVVILGAVNNDVVIIGRRTASLFIAFHPAYHVARKYEGDNGYCKYRDDGGQYVRACWVVGMDWIAAAMVCRSGISAGVR